MPSILPHYAGRTKGIFMRIVVTGGAGFIGSNFVRHLLANRYDGLVDASVVVLDALTYSGTLTNLTECLDNPRFSFVKGDIRDREIVGATLAGADFVVHFAAESHVDRSVRDAGIFIETNVLGTSVLLDAALAHGVTRFVHVSTDEVYGSIDSGSWDENQPLLPNSPYAASKAGSDLIVRSYHRTHQLDTVTTRCSNNYGTHQFPEKVIPLFVTNLIDGLTVPLYGDGLNVRDWLHVDDHCRGIALALVRGRAGEVYNIGGGTELTNTELTRMLLEATGTDWSRVDQVEDRKGHDRRYSVDISKATAELGYLPLVSFGDGLLDTVEWFRTHRDWWEPLKQRASLA